MLTIKVKTKHIRSGIPGSTHECPIALAAVEAGLEDVIVGPYAISHGGHHYDLTDSAKDFIGRFDFNDDVLPFEFNLPSPYKGK